MTNEEKALVQTTTVDNSGSTTNNASNPYICGNTTDKVFALSYSEVVNFTGANVGVPRAKRGSDYAKSSSLYIALNGFSFYWLRSPNATDSSSAKIIVETGWADSGAERYVYYANAGVCPALVIEL